MKKILFIFCALFFTNNLFAANTEGTPIAIQSSIEPSESSYIKITPAWKYYTSVTIYYFRRETGEPAGKSYNSPIYRNTQTGQIAVKMANGAGLAIAYRINKNGFAYCANTDWENVMCFNL